MSSTFTDPRRPIPSFAFFKTADDYLGLGPITAPSAPYTFSEWPRSSWFSASDEFGTFEFGVVSTRYDYSPDPDVTEITTNIQFWRLGSIHIPITLTLAYAEPGGGTTPLPDVVILPGQEASAGFDSTPPAAYGLRGLLVGMKIGHP